MTTVVIIGYTRSAFLRIMFDTVSEDLLLDLVMQI